MRIEAVFGYVVGLMALGLAANVLDPEATSAWMRACFAMLGIGFLGEVAVLGLVPGRSR